MALLVELKTSSIKGNRHVRLGHVDTDVTTMNCFAIALT